MYPQSIFFSESKKNINIFILKIFKVYNLVKIIILHGCVFVKTSGPEVIKLFFKLSHLLNFFQAEHEISTAQKC